MYSSQDLERLYLDYQSEWVPQGMTLRAYCTGNNVPLKVMENFIKGIHKRIVEVDVIGKPIEGERYQLPVPGTKASPEFLRAIAYDHYLKRVTTGSNPPFVEGSWNVKTVVCTINFDKFFQVNLQKSMHKNGKINDKASIKCLLFNRFQFLLTNK